MLSIKQKFYVVTALTALCTLFLAATSFQIINYNNDTLDSIRSKSLERLLLTRDQAISFSRYIDTITVAMSTWDLDLLAQGDQHLTAIKDSAQKLFILEQIDRGGLDKLNQDIDSFHALAEILVKQTSGGNLNSVVNLEVAAKLRKQQLNIENRLRQAQEQANQGFEADLLDFRRYNNERARTMLVAVCLVALIVIFSCAGIFLGISQRIDRLKNHFAHISLDNLLEIEGDSTKDEISLLFDGTNIMLRNLSEARVQLVGKQYIENIFLAIADILIITDSSGRIIRLNSFAMAVFEAGDSQLIGHAFTELLPRDTPEYLRAPVEAFLLEGRQNEIMRESLDLQTCSGRLIPVSITISAVVNENGILDGFVCIAKDLTVEKEAALEHQETQMQLIQAERLASLGTLGAGVAHELNSPLMSILGFTDLIARTISRREGQTPTDEKILHFSGRITRSVEKMSEIIDHLREYSQKKTVEDYGQFSLNDTITEVLIKFRNQVKDFDITIEQQLDPYLPMIRGDRNEVEDVIQNLLSNSYHAFLEQPQIEARRLSVSTYMTNEGIEVAYEDNAGGIDPKILERIFEPFFTTKEPGKGKGLGLYTLQNTMKRHFGNVKVSSQYGESTSFILFFPSLNTEQWLVKKQVKVS